MMNWGLNRRQQYRPPDALAYTSIHQGQPLKRRAAHLRTRLKPLLPLCQYIHAPLSHISLLATALHTYSRWLKPALSIFY